MRDLEVMQVKRIAPTELTSDLIFRLNRIYKMELGEFVAITDNREEILFVNHTVPQKDIDGFLKVIMFQEYWVADPEAETCEFLDYVYHRYGYGTYRILLDSHAWRMEQKDKHRAKEAAKAIIPLIEREVNSDTPIVKYDERLAYEIWCAGYRLNKSTPKNCSNYGSVYEFYFGYLMGAGLLKGGAK